MRRMFHHMVVYRAVAGIRLAQSLIRSNQQSTKRKSNPMSTSHIPSAAYMASYLKWQEYYTEKFARISDSTLTGYWYLYGRHSETLLGTPREEAAYAAVNAEIDSRDMQP